MPNAAHSSLFAIVLAMLPVAVQAAPPDSRDIAVAIRRDGDAIEVDVDLLVKATSEEVWNVLTDYDHMGEFVPNVAMSRIARRAADKLEVAQTSRLELAFLEIKFDNVREIELVPLQEIRSKVVRGDMKTSSFITRLVAKGNATRITNHGRFIPVRLIPRLIGDAVIEAQTRKQFAEFRAEILRRQQLGAA